MTSPRTRVASVLTPLSGLLIAIALITPANAAARKPSPSVHAAASGHAHSKGKASIASTVLYDQLDNPSSDATSSQNFEAANDPFDNEVADDFVVPTGNTWTIDLVDVDGVYFNGPGPADSVNVVFYADAGGLPGSAIGSHPAITPSAGLATGDFSLPLVPAQNLAPGHYWVSVQVNQNFTATGQWGWNDRTVTSNSPAAYRNPGGGFGLPGCTSTWGTRSTTCGIDPPAPDQMFRLSGSSPATCTQTGTPGNDTLVGSSADDVLCGLGGKDFLVGKGGRDILLGGADNDTLEPGSGADYVDGGGGTNRVDYSDASAGVTVNLTTGTATGGGTDTLLSIHHVTGSPYSDDITGSSALNRLDGGDGEDTLKGLGGSDYLAGEFGDDTLDGGSGIDAAVYTTAPYGITTNLANGATTDDGYPPFGYTDTLISIESVYGSNYADTINGSPGANWLYGQGGADTLRGKEGNDTLVGGTEVDALNGGTGTDTCQDAADTKTSCEH